MQLIELLNKRPITLLAQVGPYKVWEDPKYGDEATVIVSDDSGRWYNTDWWEAPSLEEIIDALR